MYTIDMYMDVGGKINEETLRYGNEFLRVSATNPIE